MTLTDEEICTDLSTGHTNYHGTASPPIFQTSTFTFDSFHSFTTSAIETVTSFSKSQEQRANFVYTRGVNPTVHLLEQKLAQLERGDQCKCFGSGMGAISAVFLSLLASGDHVLFVNSIYNDTTALLTYLEKFNIQHSHVDNQINNVEKAIKPNTKIIYVESPGTMLMQTVDLKALSALAKKHDIITVIDNTWSTPLFQKPLELGFDLSIHSLTKYLGGHSDVIGGAVIGSQKLIDTIFVYGHQLNGAVLGPFDAYLVLRGLRTLPVRMAQHQANVLKVIGYLKQHNAVATVHHPYTATGANKSLNDSQMSGYSGVLSFELKQTGYENVCKFIDALKLFKIGISWGGFESLVNSPITSNDKDKLAMLKKRGMPLGLIRLSIGLEGAEAQIADLEQAFQSLAS